MRTSSRILGQWSRSGLNRFTWTMGITLTVSIGLFASPTITLRTCESSPWLCSIACISTIPIWNPSNFWKVVPAFRNLKYWFSYHVDMVNKWHLYLQYHLTILWITYPEVALHPHGLPRLRIANLKFLRAFYLTFEEQLWRVGEPMHFLRPFLTEIPPTNIIERVVISLKYKYQGIREATWNPFHGLENILVKDRFRSLREVVFYAQDRELWDVDANLEPYVKSLRKQGINAKMQLGVFFIFTFFLKLDIQKISKAHMISGRGW